MFPSSNSPHVVEAQRPEARSWEALDRTSGPRTAPRAESPTAAPKWRAAAGRALGLARAFLTLDDAASTADAADRPHELAAPPAHPHRQPLRASHRSRRPGAAAPRPQHCLTPLERRPARATTRTPTSH